MVTSSFAPPLRVPLTPPLAFPSRSPPLSPSSIGFRSPRSSCFSAEETSSAPNLASAKSLYEVLGLPMGATSQEIKSAYRRLARVCHPDVADCYRKDSSADDFMKIHAAYTTLSDPKQRADYDRRISRPHRSFHSYSVVSASSSPAISKFSGYRGRNWETDQCW